MRIGCAPRFVVETTEMGSLRPSGHRQPNVGRRGFDQKSKSHNPRDPAHTLPWIETLYSHYSLDKYWLLD
jgi:hypothetical protein